MMLWAVVAEWVKGGVEDPALHRGVLDPRQTTNRLEPLRKDTSVLQLPTGNIHHHPEDSQPLWLRLWLEKSQRKQMRRLKRKCDLH